MFIKVSNNIIPIKFIEEDLKEEIAEKPKEEKVEMTRSKILTGKKRGRKKGVKLWKNKLVDLEMSRSHKKLKGVPDLSGYSYDELSE